MCNVRDGGVLAENGREENFDWVAGGGGVGEGWWGEMHYTPYTPNRAGQPQLENTRLPSCQYVLLP